MIGNRRAGFRIFAVARPKDTELLGNLLVSHTRIVGDAAFARDPQFVEDLARLGERETVRPAEGVCDVLDNAPILPRLARTLDRLVDFDDSALDLGHGAFILLLQASGQHNIGVPRRVVQEKVDGSEEFKLVEAASDERVVRKRDLRVETDRQKSLDLPPITMMARY